MLRIAELRKARGMSQRELAAALGVSCVAVAKWELGVNFPSTAKLPDIARVLGVDVGALFKEV